MESNINYVFKFSGVKFSVDISTAKRFESSEKAADSKTIIHYHAKHELLFVGDTPLSFLTSEGVCEYKSGIVSIPPFQKHHTNRTHYFRILFSFETSEQKNGDFSSFIKRFFSAKQVSVLKISDSAKVYVNQLSSIITSVTETNSEAATALLSLIFYDIYLSNHSSLEQKSSTKESYLIIIERLINSAAIESQADINLKTLANQLHLSEKQASRIIYKYFGKPLSALVNEKRLTEAADLLTYTDMSVYDISRKVGFRSENYFFRQFKLTYGKTPLAYRKSSPH